MWVYPFAVVVGLWAGWAIFTEARGLVRLLRERQAFMRPITRHERRALWSNPRHFA